MASHLGNKCCKKKKKNEIRQETFKFKSAAEITPLQKWSTMVTRFSTVSCCLFFIFFLAFFGLSLQWGFVLKENIFVFQREFARDQCSLDNLEKNKLALNCWDTGEARKGCCRNRFSQHTIWFELFFFKCQFENCWTTLPKNEL